MGGELAGNLKKKSILRVTVASKVRKHKIWRKNAEIVHFSVNFGLR